MNSEFPVVVVKIGGSLLTLPDFASRWCELHNRLADERLVIICGGGETADLVRRWQPLHGLSEEQAHWLAVRAMSVNELLLAQLLPDAVLAGSREEIITVWNDGKTPTLSAEHFLRHEEPHATTPLPHDWSATSDSIAAWVTRQLNCRRLILIKSCDFPADGSLQDAAARGLVDDYFPEAADGLTIDWINLRADMPQLTEWIRGAVEPPSDASPA